MVASGRRTLIADLPDPAAKITLDQVEANPVRCPDADAWPRRWKNTSSRSASSRTPSAAPPTLVALKGVPAGWGEPVFDKLRADLGKAMFSLPAVMGVEFGQGFAVAHTRGTGHSDTFVPVPENSDKAPPIETDTNRHGGMLGGISSGMPIVLRCAVKPTSSIPQDRPTVDREGNPTTLATRGRHDPCLLPRFVPMAEAMMAITLADHMLRQNAALVKL